jgi:tetratricopeptide (TPR) repeat protein
MLLPHRPGEERRNRHASLCRQTNCLPDGLGSGGQVKLALGDLPAARRTAEELKICVEGAVDKKLARHHYYLAGMIESEAGHFSSAVDNLNKAIALLGAESWYTKTAWKAVFFAGLAAVYFKSGDLARAEETYRKIQSFPLVRLQCGDVYAVSFYWLGKIAEEEGRPAEAAESYRRFLDLWKNADPDLPEVVDARKRLAGL